MVTTDSPAPLFGLVLTGGRSSRMGEDKGAIVYDSKPQVNAALEILEPVCEQVFASVNTEQSERPLYTPLPIIVDDMPDRGPAGGLLSAWEKFPDAAWLVLAVDMPRVTQQVLRLLVENRRQDSLATVLCHADGTIEPLCAIWEPATRQLVVAEMRSGKGSLRHVLEACNAEIVRLPEPDRLISLNTPAQKNTWLSAVNKDDGAQ